MQVAVLLSMIQVRGATADELFGAASAMWGRAVVVPLPAGRTGIDLVGTGGDHAGTFNVSTAAAIVTAAAGREEGLCVAKHGNKAVTSRSGLSQALAALGVTLGVTGPTLTRCLEEAGIAFFHAPADHPAMKHAGPVRAELGFRTIFNLVGPLTNPAGVRRILLGVYDLALLPRMAEVLGRLGIDHAAVVSGLIPDADGVHTDGLDEVSTCGDPRTSPACVAAAPVNASRSRTRRSTPPTWASPGATPPCCGWTRPRPRRTSSAASSPARMARAATS